MDDAERSRAGTRPAWWRGARGEWYVAGQVVVMALVLLGPRNEPGWAPWPRPLALAATIAGALLALGGAALFVAGLARLGANLTPLPRPRDDATLVDGGAYGIVRHPMYAGGLALALAWALLVHGSLTLLYAAVALVYFDFKAGREERWLMEKFPGYADYRRRVRKLIPFVR
jgi:protein-S-isoprenylcysteine O-methyltransferase Ste14